MILLILVLHLLVSVPVDASAGSKAELIGAYLQKCSEAGLFNGSALVAEHGTVIARGGYGFANMEWGIRNAPDTKFRLASVTKQFTAMAVLQLVQQGKLKLDGKITDYLPDYPKAAGDRVTVHHLLTHSSGIASYTSMPGVYPGISRLAATPAEFIKVFKDSALHFEPGTRYEYSNSGYFLLGLIMEKVTGKPYAQLIQESIFGPLGMKNSGYDLARPLIKNRAAGYDNVGGSFLNTEYIDMTVPYSAGALYSTVEDLYLWDQALYTDRLLRDDLRQLLFTPHIRAGSGSYGYGWSIQKASPGRNNDSLLVIQHQGGINGFSTIIYRIPADRQLVVLLSNVGSNKLPEITAGICAILYGYPYEMPKPSLADALFGTIMEKGLPAATARYREMRRANSHALVEEEMNGAGYRLLSMGKIDEAIEVFRLNVEAFPASWNVYDSLGEAYAAKGEKELAVRNYRRSIELNPKNAGGVQALKRLEGQ